MNTPATGDLIAGRYELAEEVGSGGFAAAYRALDRGTGETVAIKLPNYDGSSNEPELIDRYFTKEAETLERIRASGGHPNLMDLIERTDVDGTPALVVEFVDGYELDTGAFTFEVPGEAVPDGIDPASVTIGIRPQDLQAAEGAGADALTMETEVGVIEPLGTDAIVHAEAAGERVTAMMEEYQRFDQGESLTFAIDPNHVYLFDGADGTLLKGRRAGQAIEGEPTADA